MSNPLPPDAPSNQPTANQMHSENISLPTSPEKLATKLFWLETHTSEAFSPLGVRYLQLRQTAKKIGGLEQEKLAYEKELPKLLMRFRDAVSLIECDVLVQCPSCNPHAAEFAGAATKSHPKAIHLILTYDCNTPDRPRAGMGASVDQLAKAMFPIGSAPDLRTAKRIVIIDDVFSEGKTAAAVVQKLWELGLDRNVSISVVVALRVMPNQATPKYNFSEVLKTIRSSEQQG